MVYITNCFVWMCKSAFHSKGTAVTDESENSALSGTFRSNAEKVIGGCHFGQRGLSQFVFFIKYYMKTKLK
jgi:hypothetical protein